MLFENVSAPIKCLHNLRHWEDVFCWCTTRVQTTERCRTLAGWVVGVLSLSALLYSVHMFMCTKYECVYCTHRIDFPKRHAQIQHHRQVLGKRSLWWGGRQQAEHSMWSSSRVFAPHQQIRLLHCARNSRPHQRRANPETCGHTILLCYNIYYIMDVVTTTEFIIYLLEQPQRRQRPRQRINRFHARDYHNNTNNFVD